MTTTALTRHQDIGWWFVPFGNEWLFVLSPRRDAWTRLEQVLRGMGFFDHQIALARIMLQYPRVAEKRQERMQRQKADFSRFEGTILGAYYAEANAVEAYFVLPRRFKRASDSAFTVATAHLRQAKERL